MPDQPDSRASSDAPTESRVRSAEELFDRAARRVLARRGLTGEALEAELVRLRSVDPGFRLPNPEALRAEEIGD